MPKNEQLAFDSVPNDSREETGDKTETDPKPKRVAFGRYVKPEMYDVFGDYDLSGVTESQKEWLAPQNLAHFLFARVARSKQTVDGLALNAHEYNLIARSPDYLGQAAITRTLGDNDLSDERIAASERAKRHVFAYKHEAMIEHISKMQTRRQDIKLLRREAKAPGYAHLTTDKMKELIAGAWQEFQIILDVVHIQRNWDDSTRAQAEATMVYYLTQGSQSTRVGHWKAMLELADNYLGARIAKFKAKDKQVDI